MESEMADNSQGPQVPTLKDLCEAINAISLTQMKLATVLKMVTEMLENNINKEDYVSCITYIDEAFEESDRITSKFEKFDW